ncbi:hypothetical protein QCA50_019309 [Cerrena zonata]|uniref:Uncharacterized protein n=1 Tax=Cerrena zonata TaxID=2478898 RepID=A0AAW0FKI0_9APHY
MRKQPCSRHNPEVPLGPVSNSLPLSALTPPAKEVPRLNGPVTGLTPIPAFSFFGTAASNRAMTTPTKKSTGTKRKGEYMDAVEVSTYRAVRRRTASLPEPKIGPPMRKSAQLRRTRSMTKVDRKRFRSRETKAFVTGLLEGRK